MEMSDDDDIVVIQTSNDVKNGANDTSSVIRQPEVPCFKTLDDISHQSEVDRKPVVLDVFSISPRDFIQIDDESGNEMEQKQVKTETCPVSDQNDVSESGKESPDIMPKTENLSNIMARLEALEKRQDKDQVKIEALQNEVAAYRQIVRALKRRVTELEHDKPPSKRSRTSSSYSGSSTSTSVEDTEESICSEVETESVSSSGIRETEMHPDSSVNAVQNVKSEEIIVTPNLEILSDDSIQTDPTDEDGVEVSDSNSKTLPDDMNDFIARFKEAMHDRGLTYADIMKWSSDHSHSLAPGKISLFLNEKLDVAKSREMMDILSGYLDSAKSLPTEQDPPQLPENLAFEIEKVEDKLNNFGLNAKDFVDWANTNLNVKFKKSHVRRFLKKRLDEDESHEMVALLHTYIEQKSCKPFRRRSSGVKQRFSLEQLQILESALKENLYPSRADIEELTKKLNTTSNRVRNWFVNRRQAMRLRKNST